MNDSEITLKQLRESRRMTVQELGDHANFGVKAILNFENGTQAPRRIGYYRLAKALDVEITVIEKIFERS